MTEKNLTVVDSKPLTVAEIKAQVNLIQKVMKDIMKEGEHYGNIPGCDKPSLWKSGAEKIATTFRISVDTEKIERIVTDDCVKFIVTARATHGDKFLGSATGTCSSNEEKYKWRKPACPEEWDDYPEDRKREKWIKEKWDNRTGKKVAAHKIKQIRTEPDDLENTILQMADKRAYVACVRKVTAASDVFTQDIEDLPEGMEAPEGTRQSDIKRPVPKKGNGRDNVETSDDGVTDRHPGQQRKPGPQQQKKQPSRVPGIISDKQLKRLLAIAYANGYTDDDVDLYIEWQYPDINGKENIPYQVYNEIVSNFEKGKGQNG